ncbi:MAG: aminotransferase class V-fold PLP-dependent enzyme, partial [Gammaproteobacteria bacterium]
MTAAEVNALRERDPSVVVLDGRSPAEYRKMSLPGALCCPNAELGYRIQSLVPDEATTIVINCAGRTRSILGVEGLRVLNTRNPVFALENGTQGWRLAGLDLQRGIAPQTLPDPDDEQVAALGTTARALIASSGLELVSLTTTNEWLRDEERTTYLLDVRTKAEFSKAHFPGARHAPGGQLVQATDEYVAVRNARIVLSDDNRLRATTTAIRLQDMGHDVYLLDADASTADSNEQSGESGESSFVDSAFPDVDATKGMTILDASPGMTYRAGHIAGAQWVTRARLEKMQLDAAEHLLVTGQDDALLEGIATELRTLGFNNFQSCAGSPRTWADAGHEVVATPDVPADEDCIDYLFFVHDRHDDNMDAARRYLEWETGLIAQLDEQERSALNPRAQFGVLSYGRRGTTTAHALMQAVNDLEGGDGCWLFPTGVAAISTTLQAFLHHGDHLLMAETAFHATKTVYEKFLRPNGVELDAIPWHATDLAEWIKPQTKVVFVESPGSNTLEVMDLPALCKSAHEHGALVIADNTYGSGWLYRPLQLGCDVSIIAGTKYLSGHADVMMGAATARGEAVKALRESVLAGGQTLAPDEAYATLRGIRTLNLRMERHQKNTLEVVRWLEARDEVTCVLHPDLP